MIQELDIESDEERQNIESYLTIIRGLLQMNLEAHTTFELEEIVFDNSCKILGVKKWNQ